MCDRTRVLGTAQVYGNARVYDDVQVYGNTRVFDSSQVYDHARVCENAQVLGHAEVSGNMGLRRCSTFGACSGHYTGVYNGKVLTEWWMFTKGYLFQN